MYEAEPPGKRPFEPRACRMPSTTLHLCCVQSGRLAQGLIRDESMLKHRYTLSQTPSQAAFIERFNQTLRQKLRLAVQSELGSISQSRASEERVNMTNPKAWRALIARAVEANNNEVAAGTGLTPNDYMERFVQDGKQSVASRSGLYACSRRWHDPCPRS